MKKLISLILALALCMTAFAAFAETLSKQAAEALAVPAPSTTDSAIVTIDNNNATAKTDSEELLNTLVTGESDVTLDDTFKSLDGLADADSVVCTPMPEITVDTGAVTAENEDTKVKITSEVDASVAEYLNTFGTSLKAVYTYVKGNTIKSVIIDFEIVGNSIVYNIPLWVLADASGCPSFINFVA